MMSSVDWPAVEAAYVTGPDSTTLDGLAARHGVTGPAVRHRAARGGWGERRRQYREEAAGRAVERAVERLADRVSDVQERFGEGFEREGLRALEMAAAATNANEHKGYIVSAAVSLDKLRLMAGLVSAAQVVLQGSADARMDDEVARFIASLTPDPSVPGGPEPEDGEDGD